MYTRENDAKHIRTLEADNKQCISLYQYYQSYTISNVWITCDTYHHIYYIYWNEGWAESLYCNNNIYIISERYDSFIVTYIFMQSLINRQYTPDKRMLKYWRGKKQSGDFFVNQPRIPFWFRNENRTPESIQFERYLISHIGRKKWIVRYSGVPCMNANRNWLSRTKFMLIFVFDSVLPAKR